MNNEILSGQKLEKFLLEIQNEAYGLQTWNLEIKKVEILIPELSLFILHCRDNENENENQCLYIVRTDLRKGTFPFHSWEKFNDKFWVLKNLADDSEAENPVFLRLSDLKDQSFSPYTKISPAPGGEDFYFMEDIQGDLRWIDLNTFSESIYFKSMISFNEKNGVMLVEYLEQGFFMFMKGHSNSSAFREYKTFGDGTFALLIGEADLSSRENHDTTKSAEPSEKNDTLRIFMFHTMKEYEPDK